VEGLLFESEIAKSSFPWDETVLMLPGVPRELGATLDEREQRELKVSV
jgi:hypothetical protein